MFKQRQKEELGRQQVPLIQHPAHKLTEIFYSLDSSLKPKILLFRVLFLKTSLTQKYASIHDDA